MASGKYTKSVLGATGRQLAPEHDLSFIMRPHADDFYDILVVDRLVDQAMLNIGAAGIGPG